MSKRKEKKTKTEEKKNTKKLIRDNAKRIKVFKS